RQHLGGECDLLGVPGAGYGDLVAGGDGEARQRRSELTGAQDAETALGSVRRLVAHATACSVTARSGAGPSASISSTSGITFVPKSSTARSLALAGTAPPVE